MSETATVDAVKRAYEVRWNGELVGTRKSFRPYTHAVVVLGHSRGTMVDGYCGRPDLATSRVAGLRKWASYRGERGLTFEAVPVTWTEVRSRSVRAKCWCGATNTGVHQAPNGYAHTYTAERRDGTERRVCRMTSRTVAGCESASRRV